MKTMIKLAVAVAAFGLLASPALANMTTYNFSNITANNVIDAGIGESQLTMQVSSTGNPAQALFTFLNSGPLASSICDIYFQDGTLLSMASVTSGPGVSISQFASPPNLSGGAPFGFATHAGFLADSNPPVEPNGVNPGGWVGILFNLLPTKTYADVITALDLGETQLNSFVPNSLRVGIHVQGFAGGGSESFINGGQPVPAPAGVLLCGLGLGLVGWVKRRFA